VVHFLSATLTKPKARQDYEANSVGAWARQTRKLGELCSGMRFLSGELATFW
jgi:hypothetical protein